MPKIIRSKEIKVRLSHAEHERLLRLCGNKPLASWLRDTGLGERALDFGEAGAPPPKADPALLRHIAAVGNNLNQIARTLNNVEISPAVKIQHLTTLSQIETAIKNFAG